MKFKIPNKSSSPLIEMKKTTVYICFFISVLCYPQECSITPFDAALFDESGSDTNIRYEPNGVIMLKLNASDYFGIHVIDYKDGWLEIDKATSVEFNYEISNLNGWIHHSVVALWTRKKINALDVPITGVSLGEIDQEMGPVFIKDICNDWIKIEFDGLIGWVELKLLCSSPVTTCP